MKTKPRSTRSLLGALVLTMFIPVLAWAADPAPDALKVARTTEEILSAIQPLKGFGHVQTAQFERRGRQVFAAWYCPFSGRAASFLRAYYFDPTRSEWIQFVDRLVEGCFDLSAEMPVNEPVIVFRGPDGNVVLREAVATLPQRSTL
jgi:hypothetical protein